MKILLSVVVLFFVINTSFASEPLCNSTSGDFLSFKVVSSFLNATNDSSSFFVGNVGSKDSKYFSEIRDSLMSEFKKLCDSGAKSEEIILKMYGRCTKLSTEKIKNKGHLEKYIDACDLGYRAAKSFVEGSESSAKCEEKNSISNLSRTSKDITNTVEIKESSKPAGTIGK